ncbi:MAG: winged helix-turn-helix transcriptional regulator [Beijerinckiaceae bacterium]|nr:winged helix-turn-helix transcriptional regulator [Beijerinckiaceae bacterium]
MITDRDREIVELLDRSGGLEANSLRLMLGLGRPVVYRRLARLEEYGMVRSARPFRNTRAIYLPTRLGLRELLGLDDTRGAEVTAWSYNHQCQVGERSRSFTRAGWSGSRHVGRADGSGRPAKRAITMPSADTRWTCDPNAVPICRMR